MEIFQNDGQRQSVHIRRIESFTQFAALVTLMDNWQIDRDTVHPVISRDVSFDEMADKEIIALSIMIDRFGSACIATLLHAFDYDDVINMNAWL